MNKLSKIFLGIIIALVVLLFIVLFIFFNKEEQTYDISFHNLVSYFNDYIYYNNVYSLRLEAHVQTEEEGTWVRITCVVDTCLCYTFTH